jgi:hypothetical protein
VEDDNELEAIYTREKSNLDYDVSHLCVIYFLISMLYNENISGNILSYCLLFFFSSFLYGCLIWIQIQRKKLL